MKRLFFLCIAMLCLLLADSVSAERLSVRFMRLDKEAKEAKARGDYALALRLYNEALTIPASESNLAAVSLNKSDLQILTGQYSEAEELLKSISASGAEQELRRLSNLSALYAQTGREEDATKVYEELLDQDNLDLRNRGIVCQNFGYLRMMQGRWSDAVKLYRDGAIVLETDSVVYPIVVANLALAESLAGDDISAKTDITNAMALFDRYADRMHPDRMAAIRKKGEIYLKSGDTSGAERAFFDYFKGERENVLANYRQMSVQQRLDYWKKEKNALSLIFGLEQSAPELLLDVSVFRRNVSFLDNGADIDRYLHVTGKELRKALRNNEAVVDFIIYPKRNDGGILEENIGALVVCSESVGFVPLGSMHTLKSYKIMGRDLGSAVSTDDPGLLNAIYRDKGLTDKIWGDVLKVINNKTTVYFAPDGIINNLGVENLSGLPFDKQFVRITNPVFLTGRNNGKGSADAKRGVNLLLAGGFDYDYTGQGDIVEKEGTMPVDHSAVDFLKRRFENVYFKNLPGSRKEIDLISQFYPKAVIRYKVEEEELPELLKKFNRIHIATHGYAVHAGDDDNKYVISDSLKIDHSLLACGLVFSGANKMYLDSCHADGLLSARELCNYDLSNVDFFVLSACRTADGEATDEGPAGLIRGLKRAGVKTILATLWEVDDEAATIFMEKFYDMTNKGHTIREAFLSARNHLKGYEVKYPEIEEHYNPATMTTEYVETGKTVNEYPFSAPSFWAPFVLIDEI